MTLLRLYRHPLSGHAHRAQLMLSLLRLPFDMVEVDLLSGAQKAPGFLAKNAFGQVPVLEDGEVTIADSNAILVYLANRYDPDGQWLPRDPVAAAEVHRWLGVAAGELVKGPCAARLDVLFGRPRDPACHEVAARLFGIMTQQLGRRPFLAHTGPTIADVALYTYTRHAPEGGVAIDAYPAMLAWLERIEALPGFVGMQRHSDGPALLV